MVRLNRIYTRAGDDGTTRLVTGDRVSKADRRVEAYGTVDETNAAIGHARAAITDADLDAVLAGVQNDLFDLGADVATPPEVTDALRVTGEQVERLEGEIDRLNAGLPALESFVLPAGTEAAARLHVARTVCRRAERRLVELADREDVSAEAAAYANRLSDLLFVASRWVNVAAGDEVLWHPGMNTQAR